MIAGLASSLPHTLTSGLQQQDVPAHVATQVATLPPVSSLFAAQLGINPIEHLLQPSGALTHLSAAQQQTLTGREFFPSLIAGPFHSGLVIVFAFGATLAFLAAIASLIRGTSPPPTPQDRKRPPPVTPSRDRTATPAAETTSPPDPGNQQTSTGGTTTMALTTIDPRSALVVIDLQKGIVSAHAGSPVTAVVEQATHLATEFRRHGLPVVLVNVTGRAPGRTEAGWSGSGAALPTGWADLIDELDVQPTDHLITKRRRSAFHDTGLDTLLRDLGRARRHLDQRGRRVDRALGFRLRLPRRHGHRRHERGRAVKTLDSARKRNSYRTRRHLGRTLAAVINRRALVPGGSRPDRPADQVPRDGSRCGPRAQTDVTLRLRCKAR